MQLFQIPGEQRSRLIKLPETGLGYQLVEANNDLWWIVNATTAFSPLRSGEMSFTAEDYEALSGDPYEGPASRLPRLDLPQDVRVLASQNEFFATGRVAPFFGFNLANPVPPPATIIPTRQARSYYRFSAFSRDLRVTSDGFEPGTYATTYADLHFVPSGFAAVGRYALPNPASACWVFQIVTFDRPTLMGTAVPNFGQAGGGVEVFFRDGATHAPGASFRINVG